ncbi:hypothetical protein MK139_00990, partial [bacterium]|nr:hypothetical protein [bacterium]
DTADDEAAEPDTFQGSDDETDHSEEDGGFDDDGIIDDNGQDEISDLEELKSRPSTEYVRFFGLEKVPAAKEEEMAV